jgi:hypothetical protein
MSPTSDRKQPAPAFTAAADGKAKAPLVVLIESDPAVRAAMHRLLRGWGLRVVETDLDSAMPARDEHTEAAAIIADYELGASADRRQPFTGLDVALLIARRAGHGIPTLVTSDDFGRNAIPACSPHRFPVMFKPVAPEDLRAWLHSVSLPTDPARRPARSAA